MTPQPPGSSRLFPDTPAGPPGGVYIANIDGASRGNPGPASYALILKDASGKLIFQLGKKIGRQTNNVAEYYALLAALDYAIGHSLKALRIRSDSDLLVQQMKGRYKVKNPGLKPLHERASKLSRQLEYFVIEHVAREMNRDADALANQALDSSAIQYQEASESAPGASSKSDPRQQTRPQRPQNPPQFAASGQKHANASQKSRTIRARFVNGALVPWEPLDLPEGSIVTLIISNP